MKLITVFIIALLTVQIAHAQTFPLNVLVVWDPNPSTDVVTNYSVIHNGVQYNVLPSSCSATECTRQITLNGATNTVSVQAVNQWGISAATSITFTASAPGKSGNVRIRVQ